MRVSVGIMSVIAILGCSAVVATRGPTNASGSKLQTAAGGMIEIGDVTEENIALSQARFDERVALGDKTILFRINSFGGSVYTGLDFIQHVEQVKKAFGLRVQCVVDVKAMSMGFVFLQSFCDERYMTKRAVLLAHNTSATAKGTALDLLNEAEFLRALDKSLASICSRRLAISFEDYVTKVEGKDWTMAWEEALAVGAIDSVVDSESLPALYLSPSAVMPRLNFLGAAAKSQIVICSYLSDTPSVLDCIDYGEFLRAMREEQADAGVP